jgi:hypothetical protein
VLVERLLQCLVGVDQALHRVVVGRRVRRRHVRLYASSGPLAPACELVDQVVARLGWVRGM